MADLSILIPSRNEMFLKETVESLVRNIRGNTEVIIVLDGAWANPPIMHHKLVNVIYVPESIGQRASANLACRLSRAKYVMKVDAHCDFDEGFDVKMMEKMQDNYTMVPIMYNLHAFDWVCTGKPGEAPCGHRLYQSPTPSSCPECAGGMKREMIWKPRFSRKSTSYRFDKTLHFQYWNSYLKRFPPDEHGLSETLSLQGSCFMLTRKKYWELNICDEAFGSWGQQGTEVACKTWLSGGRVVVNHNTWYSHMFRTQGGDFGFPYPQSGKQVDHARAYSRDLFMNNKFHRRRHRFSWLIDKFKPIPDWHE